MESKNTPVHNIQQSWISARVSEAALISGVWYDGVCRVKGTCSVFRTKAAVKSHDATKAITHKNTLGSLYFRFGINFSWLTVWKTFPADKLFMAPIFSYTKTCKVLTMVRFYASLSFSTQYSSV